MKYRREQTKKPFVRQELFTNNTLDINMAKKFASIFANLVRTYEKSSSDEVLAVFVKKFGQSWATDVTQYVAEDVIRENRPEYHSFYFDQSIPLSVRADPRSGMFCRNPEREGGKIEILLHLAMGLEGFVQLLKVPRVIAGERMSVIVANRPLRVDHTSFEMDFDRVRNNLSSLDIQWDDNLLLPSFEDGLIKAKQALLKLESATSYDEDALFNLSNVMLCGAHCRQCPKSEPPSVDAAIKMAKIMAVGGAIRGEAQALSASIGFHPDFSVHGMQLHESTKAVI